MEPCNRNTTKQHERIFFHLLHSTILQSAISSSRIIKFPFAQNKASGLVGINSKIFYPPDTRRWKRTKKKIFLQWVLLARCKRNREVLSSIAFRISTRGLFNISGRFGFTWLQCREVFVVNLVTEGFASWFDLPKIYLRAHTAEVSSEGLHNVASEGLFEP